MPKASSSIFQVLVDVPCTPWASVLPLSSTITSRVMSHPFLIGLCPPGLVKLLFFFFSCAFFFYVILKESAWQSVSDKQEGKGLCSCLFLLWWWGLGQGRWAHQAMLHHCVVMAYPGRAHQINNRSGGRKTWEWDCWAQVTRTSWSNQWHGFRGMSEVHVPTVPLSL